MSSDVVALLTKFTKAAFKPGPLSPPPDLDMVFFELMMTDSLSLKRLQTWSPPLRRALLEIIAAWSVELQLNAVINRPIRFPFDILSGSSPERLGPALVRALLLRQDELKAQVLRLREVSREQSGRHCQIKLV